MEEEILNTFVKPLVTELLQGGKTLFSRFQEDGLLFINKNLSEYLEKGKKRHAWVKTLLRGNVPVYLYDIYYPLKLSGYDGVFATNSILDIFRESDYVTVIGDAGSGKTTLLRHLFLSAVYEKSGVPVVVELRYLNEYEGSILDYIFELFTVKNVPAKAKAFEEMMLKGKFVFFFDGFDELDSNAKNYIIKDLKSFLAKFIRNKFVITSRPYSGIENLEVFHNYYLEDLSLDDGDICSFVKKQLGQEKELSDKVVKSIQTNSNDYINSYLKNPLLLSLYILTFQNYRGIPSQKHIFYGRVIQTLFCEHDMKTKFGFERERVSGLNQDEFEDLLRVFSFLSHFENKFEWSRDYALSVFKIYKERSDTHFDSNKVISDLKSSVALWAEDSGVYQFSHRSLQEYFAAKFITNIDSSQRAAAYEKILNVTNATKLTELGNLMSLLREMDNASYLKYYKVVVLESFWDIISIENQREIAEGFLMKYIFRIKYTFDPMNDTFAVSTVRTNDSVHLSLIDKSCIESVVDVFNDPRVLRKVKKLFTTKSSEKKKEGQSNEEFCIAEQLKSSEVRSQYVEYLAYENPLLLDESLGDQTPRKDDIVERNYNGLNESWLELHLPKMIYNVRKLRKKVEVDLRESKKQSNRSNLLDEQILKLL